MRGLATHLAKPWRTRRYTFLLSVVVALGLVIFSNLSGSPLMGENLLMTLVGGGGLAYTGGRVIERVKGVSDPEDI